MGDPLNMRMTGIVINQPDLPHWCIGILNWLSKVNGIQQATGEIGNRYRGILKYQLETGDPYSFINVKTGKVIVLSGPATVYAVYQDFSNALEVESNR